MTVTTVLLVRATSVTARPACTAISRIRAAWPGLPVQVPRLTDTSPVGAAMCAAVAGGLQGDLVECAGLVGEIAETVTPDPARRAAYDEAYGAYHRLFDSLRPLFENNAV
ncbi:MAG: hypothetical protein IH786_09635 [Proteobacteria bacterium]|nr:hypothetical protein [Pseudomonadota bacterium]